MSNNWFKFKRFTVNQEDCAMKVGTDGVLLGAWADIPQGCSVLDIGTGTGLIALMAAQKGAGSVTAVEFDVAASVRAASNVAVSEWADRIAVINCDIADYHPDTKYDRILSNPPYFRDALRSPDYGRNLARHNDSLSYETLIGCSASMLADNGTLSVVLPYDEVEEFVRRAQTGGLYMSKRTDVMTSRCNNPKRSLLTFSSVVVQPVTDVLRMRDDTGEETSDYINLVKDFYLRF